MSRKQAVCCLIITILVAVVVLLVLAVISVWLVLPGILVMVLVVGLLVRLRPELFEPLRRDAVGYAMPGSTGTGGEEEHFFGLILIGLNTPTRTQIVIDKPRFTIGRDGRCDYVLTRCSDISRVHVVLQLDPVRGSMTVTDKNSHNGTFLNNHRLEPNQPQCISGGDVLQLGTLRFAVQDANY